MSTITTEAVFDAFLTVAPELEDELRRLDPDADVWESAGFDSMDHLSVMEQLARAIGRDIPECDYPQLLTLAAIERYVDALTG